MSEASEAVALEIMALVDEYPSEPLSFERRNILDLINLKICHHTQESEDSLDEGFQVGVDEGRYQMEQETKVEIKSLKDKISELEKLQTEEYERGYAKGFDAGYDAGQESVY